MSNEIPENHKKIIYYGTIEQKAMTDGNNRNGLQFRKGAALQTAIEAGNINIGDTSDREVLELSETSKLAQQNHAQLLKRVEAEKRARTLTVPTSILDVIAKLRQLNQPMTLFGENAADRRERLRSFMSHLEIDGEEKSVINQFQQDEISKEVDTGEPKGKINESIADRRDELFYIPIPNKSGLKKARLDISELSFQYAHNRLQCERHQNQLNAQELEQLDHKAAQVYVMAQQLTISASQVGDTRPVVSAKYSPNSHHVLTGSWTSLIKLWNSRTCEHIQTFNTHKERITDIAWNPKYDDNEMMKDNNSVAFLSGSADNTAKIWSLCNSEPIQNLIGHQARLGKVGFHPFGKYVGTTSYDHTWRLWDIETGESLLLQEGHYCEVHAISFQCDGSLVATGDLNGIGRVWDIRCGKSIFNLQGHSKEIISMDFSKNGYSLASGSGDHSIRIWDLRKKECFYVLPAHSKLVSQVKFSPLSGEVLLSCSYDKSIKLWKTRNWDLIKQLNGHEGKVMGIDFSHDEHSILSCGFDRTFKIWAPEDEL